MGGCRGLQALALLLLRSLVCVGGAPATSDSIMTAGELFVLTMDGPGPARREVYLHTSAGASVFKLEGPAISAAHGLSTGQHARVAGRLATAGAALAHGARSSMARLTVSSLSVLKSSARKGASNHAGQPGTSGGPIQTSSHRLKRLRQVSAAPPSPSPPPEQQRLPVSQVPLQAADLPALVLPISFEGCDAPGGGQYGQPWYRPEDVESVMFEQGHASDALVTVGGRLRACSHNRTLLTRATSAVAPLHRLPCNGTNSFGYGFGTLDCQFDDIMGWLEAAEDAAAAAGIDVARYRHRVALLPPGVTCAFYGIASQGCADRCLVWVQGQDVMGGSRDAGTNAHPILHELGHNLFLNHANTYGPGHAIDTYADLTCMLGYCCGARCLNAPHAWQLGWIAPEELNGSSLAVGQPRTVTLASQSRVPAAGLRIDTPSWAGGASDPLYLSLRLPEGGDSELGPEFTAAVSVHAGASTGSLDAQPTFLLVVLPADASWQDDGSGLVVKVLSVQPLQGTATVWLCRRAASLAETRDSCLQALDGDCDGLAGPFDPDCSFWLPPTPAPLPPLLLHLPPPPRRPPPSPPPPMLSGRALPPAPVAVRRPPACALGSSFCSQLASLANQVRRSGSPKLPTGQAAVCQYWLAHPLCAGSGVPCGCSKNGSIAGSGVWPPRASSSSGNGAAGAFVAPPRRCVAGHATCAVRSRGSVCRYWRTLLGRAACSGSGIPCSCGLLLRVPPT